MKSQFSHYLSLYRNLWNYLLHTNDFTLYIKEIRPFFMPIWRLKNPPLADCVHRSKKINITKLWTFVHVGRKCNHKKQPILAKPHGPPICPTFNPVRPMIQHSFLFKKKSTCQKHFHIKSHLTTNYVDSIDMQNDNTVNSYSHLIMKHFWWTT